jgi:hypothetical protein
MFDDISFMRGCLGICITKVNPNPKFELRHVIGTLDKFKNECQGVSNKAKQFIEMAKVYMIK